jgi:hypothetical protein
VGSALVFISYLSIFCTLAIRLVLIYFSFKYKKKLQMILHQIIDTILFLK